MSPKLSIAGHMFVPQVQSCSSEAMSRKLVCICGTSSVLLEDERRWEWSCSGTSQMSADRYIDAAEVTYWCTRHTVCLQWQLYYWCSPTGVQRVTW